MRIMGIIKEKNRNNFFVARLPKTNLKEHSIKNIVSYDINWF
jgi:hypothetical protein